MELPTHVIERTKVGREAKVTYEQVAAIADALRAANISVTSRVVRERLGNVGSMGTINRLLQEWKAAQERQALHPMALPPSLQRAIMDFVSQTVATSKEQLEFVLAEQRQEMADLAIENERQAAEMDELRHAEAAVRAELATQQGRLAQTQTELAHARGETSSEREQVAQARSDLAKALLRLEAVPRLETDLATLRDELKAEHQARTVASQHAAVLEAKLEAARERAVLAEAHRARVPTAIRSNVPRDGVVQSDGGERRRKSKQKPEGDLFSES